MKRGYCPLLRYQVEETWPSTAWCLGAEQAPSGCIWVIQSGFERSKAKRTGDRVVPHHSRCWRGEVGVTSQEPPGHLRKFSGLAVALPQTFRVRRV